MTSSPVDYLTELALAWGAPEPLIARELAMDVLDEHGHLPDRHESYRTLLAALREKAEQYTKFGDN